MTQCVLAVLTGCRGFNTMQMSEVKDILYSSTPNNKYLKLDHKI
ncbi:protein of unknown function [Xenorhabdus poinarii G6]|uniref:Uncharacterized protein n=1 Tax=Xenorhabdus poinarii G6 TaxID=1354304 RepID=A0A068R2W3_9GAMM|nr:protein of unknown function [Xenorhabdus poinarii G6]